MNNSWFRREYAPNRFWNKLASHTKTIGRETIEKALYLYYAAQSPNTPTWAKRTIYGALGYFIFPFDAVPDLLPVLGYTDDLSVMAAALATVAFYGTPEIKEQVRRKLAQWFDKTPLPGNPVVER
jgi:uncharacterized membrane protein YkvA (DUF1232 family)